MSRQKFQDLFNFYVLLFQKSLKKSWFCEVDNEVTIYTANHKRTACKGYLVGFLDLPQMFHAKAARLEPIFKTWLQWRLLYVVPTYFNKENCFKLIWSDHCL